MSTPKKTSAMGAPFVSTSWFVSSPPSPAIDAGYPGLVDLLGGRQSARSLHFIGMALLAAFFAVHIAMVLASGPLGQLRAMVTGWQRIPAEGEGQA